MEHPKTVGTAYIRHLAGGPTGHYLQGWARLWAALEANSDFYVLQIEHRPFGPDAGRIYCKFHIKGLRAGVTQSAEEQTIRGWLRQYATQHGMWLDLRSRYLRPKPDAIGGILVAQTVLQLEVVACHLLRGQQSPVAPKPPDGPYQKTWRSADFPERSADALR